MKILIVEEDEFTAKQLADIFSRQGYSPEIALDGLSGKELASTFAYDLILIAIKLPKLDGISLCRQLRALGLNTPAMLLSRGNNSRDNVAGLDAGADDCIVQPCDEEELLARARALLRRSHAATDSILEWDKIRLDPSTSEATYAMQPLQLTSKEYALLELLMRNRSRAYSCGDILERLWAGEAIPDEAAVKTQVKGLRQKLKTAGAAVDLIETVYGIAYRLKSPLSKRRQQLGAQANEEARQQALLALTRVWHRLQAKVRERVRVLEQAAAAAALLPEMQQQAQQAARSLANLFNAIGWQEGSRLARQIEQILQAGKLGKAEAERLKGLVAALYQVTERSGEAIAAPELPN